MEILLENKHKVHILELGTMMRDMNLISEKFKWNVTFSSEFHVNSHNYTATPLIGLNKTSKVKLLNYIHHIGEADLYKRVRAEFLNQK